ncbi:MAG: YsnF/AvaK domain-containing protein [Anaeromyxobacteraceae bacterium]
MTVRSSDGEKLGKILALGEDTFVVEKGFFLPKDHTCRYADIAGLEGDDGDEVRLAIGKDAFARRELGSDDDTIAAGGDANLGRTQPWEESAERPPGERARAAAGQDEIRMPVAEEELEAVKTERDAGEVRLRKDVVTEHRSIDVPVTKETVRVERVPASGDRTLDTGDLEQRTESIPLREEEVEIRKRPVVKEEVRLRKERTVEHRAADADVRREEVRVEGDDESRIADRGDRDPTRRDPDDLG